jgi:hypothetical protein
MGAIRTYNLHHLRAVRRQVVASTAARLRDKGAPVPSGSAGGSTPSSRRLDQRRSLDRDWMHREMVKEAKARGSKIVQV